MTTRTYDATCDPSGVLASAGGVGNGLAGAERIMRAALSSRRCPHPAALLDPDTVGPRDTERGRKVTMARCACGEWVVIGGER